MSEHKVELLTTKLVRDNLNEQNGCLYMQHFTNVVIDKISGSSRDTITYGEYCFAPASNVIKGIVFDYGDSSYYGEGDPYGFALDPNALAYTKNKSSLSYLQFDSGSGLGSGDNYIKLNTTQDLEVVVNCGTSDDICAAVIQKLQPRTLTLNGYPLTGLNCENLEKLNITSNFSADDIPIGSYINASFTNNDLYLTISKSDIKSNTTYFNNLDINYTKFTTETSFYPTNTKGLEIFSSNSNLLNTENKTLENLTLVATAASGSTECVIGETEEYKINCDGLTEATVNTNEMSKITLGVGLFSQCSSLNGLKFEVKKKSETDSLPTIILNTSSLGNGKKFILNFKDYKIEDLYAGAISDIPKDSDKKIFIYTSALAAGSILVFSDSNYTWTDTSDPLVETKITYGQLESFSYKALENRGSKLNNNDNIEEGGNS